MPRIALPILACLPVCSVAVGPPYDDGGLGRRPAAANHANGLFAAHRVANKRSP